MTETQRLVWCLSRPICAEVNDVMQQLTSVKYATSEQHKDLSKSKARQAKDIADTNKIMSMLVERNQFEESPSLQNIVTGIVTRDDVNAKLAKLHRTFLRIGWEITSSNTYFGKRIKLQRHNQTQLSELMGIT